jgi:hypothetical protein
MKYLFIGLSVASLMAGLSAANAAGTDRAIMVIATTGNTPNSGGGVTTVRFQTMDLCNTALSQLSLVGKSGNLTIGGVCLAN